MKILDRYLLYQFIISFIWCSVAFVSFYIIIDFFGRLDEVIEGKVSLQTITSYYLNLTPLVFVRISPIATLLSIMYSLSNLSRYRELTAAISGGVHPWRLLTPFLLAGLTLSLISMTINEFQVPEAARKAYQIKQYKIRRQRDKHIWRDRIFYGSENRKFYVKLLNARKNIVSGIEITKYAKNGLELSKFQANTGKWNGSEWLFYNATLREFGPTGRVKSILRADKAKVNENNWTFWRGNITRYETGGEIKRSFEKIIPQLSGVSEIPEDFTEKQRKPEEMNFHELSEYITRLRKIGFNPQAELVALHSKISFPFANLLVMLIGIPFAMKRRSGGFLVGFGNALGICLIYYLLMSVGSVLGENFVPPVIGAWLANAIFTVTGIISLLRVPYLSR